MRLIKTAAADSKLRYLPADTRQAYQHASHLPLTYGMLPFVGVGLQSHLIAKKLPTYESIDLEDVVHNPELRQAMQEAGIKVRKFPLEIGGAASIPEYKTILLSPMLSKEFEENAPGKFTKQEIDAILAHEFGHSPQTWLGPVTALTHGFGGLLGAELGYEHAKRKGSMHPYLWTFGGGAGGILTGGLANNLIKSRIAEREADKTAAKYTGRTLNTALKKLVRKLPISDTQRKILHTRILADLLQGHPAIESRLKYITEMAKYYR